MENEFKIGDNVKCKKFASLTQDFEGVIEKLYENSAMVSITKHASEDSVVVTDFHNRAVVRLSEMKKLNA
ncbi:hypothetical protein FC40_GL000612 [Ligilactobacillus hayakitensis DSM 18933 = JCM 14209]|uniref:DUF2187 domain-containing protein n=1 Tax=Ligilactobacillus hayakitensis DSM 18933 = JCM 14209 TaxID=1423755 RepID=A0A0R1WSK4_9LACO|nr:hypothetical protein [Ligilactobacillus hayakitensis]KRM18827.1 hypothetical protein FC40_GL000612 [Ligilactobacillus hayakitensis DSM 18933 = JCM 14209]